MLAAESLHPPWNPFDRLNASDNVLQFQAEGEAYRHCCQAMSNKKVTHYRCLDWNGLVARKNQKRLAKYGLLYSLSLDFGVISGSIGQCRTMDICRRHLRPRSHQA